MASWLAIQAQTEGGRIAFERFMELALYDASHGYYSRNIRDVGRTGDFSTALTASDLLIQAIARWIMAEAKALKLSPIRIIEFGGGSGAMAKGILMRLGRWRRIEYQIVELSESLQNLQKIRLKGRNIRWQSSAQAALAAARGHAILIANEFVDAFPCRIFEKACDGWGEVNLQYDDGIWQECLLKTELPESTAFGIACDNGQRIEVFSSYQIWLNEMTECLQRGTLLTIDYGGTPDEIYHRKPNGTVRAYYQHNRSEGLDIYLRAGKQDITADVNFADLRRWGRCAGLAEDFYLTQREFIPRWMPVDKVEKAADRFVSAPEGMGLAMKVLSQRR
ncbi:MAG: SAM-dependent methyltransferase [Verrucomicrobia bacterium]|nr:SAM-dependent methyltransferase [Verrucomicrobiota bacterium]